MNVLSLFDGMSCGQIALNRAGIKYENYFASEIDKHAIKVAQHNYPNTIQLGDVTKVNGGDLPKIDLLIGGSPCQGFSFAGKGLNFEDPRSKLFFEYVRILKELREVNPCVKFLLENVQMKREHQLVISNILGIAPIIINSALVSAQNRVRLYWTNIGEATKGLFNDTYCNIPQPKDKGEILRDILDVEVDEKYFVAGPRLKWLLGSDRGNPLEKGYATINAERAQRVCARSDASWNGAYVTCGAMRGVYADGTRNGDLKGTGTKQELELREDGKTNTLTSVTKDNLVVRQIMLGKTQDFHREHTGHKSYAVDTQNKHGIEDGVRIRRLTPIECERLQTVNDNYTSIASDSQRYRMLGNGWTIDVIVHILNYL